MLTARRAHAQWRLLFPRTRGHGAARALCERSSLYSGAFAHPTDDPVGQKAALARRSLRDHAVAHLAQALDLGLHDIADLQERVGAHAHTAAGAAAENVAGLQGADVRGILDLLLGREDELRSIAVLLDLAVDGEPDEQIRVVWHEGARHQERPHGGKIVVAL